MGSDDIHEALAKVTGDVEPVKEEVVDTSKVLVFANDLLAITLEHLEHIEKVANMSPSTRIPKKQHTSLKNFVRETKGLIRKYNEE